MSRHPKLLILGAAAILATLVIGVGLAGALAPTVTVEAASEIGVTSALAKGTVNPEEKETSCHFDYISGAQFGQNPAEPFEGAAQAPCTAGPLSGATAQPVEAELTGLAPATLYHLRLVAENVEAESSNEPAPTFETAPATAPTVAVTGSSGVSYTWATLEGTVNPSAGNSNPIEGTLPIQWFLQYAPAAEAEPRNWQSANLTSTNFPIEGAAAASSTPIPLEAEAVGLQPATEYAFRTVATYAGGVEAVSPTEGSFTTLAVAKPGVTLLAPGPVSASGAELHAEVDPNSPEPEGSTSPAEEAAFETSWHFECVGAHSCGSPTGKSVKAGNAAMAVSAEATGLEPNTTYTVVLVAENLGGQETASEIAGQPVTFTTSEVEPEVTILPLFGPTLESAALRASVNPHNSPVLKCEFDWGTSAGYGQAAPCEPSPSGNEYTLAAGHLTGLSLGTTYHYKVVLQTAGGSAETPDTTFATAEPEAQGSCPNEARRVEQHATFLPDCRAYEKASPSDKNGSDVMGVAVRTRAAANGEGVEFASLGSFGDARGIGVSTEYIAKRDGAPGTSGWATHAITPGPLRSPPLIDQLNSGGADPRYLGALSPDLDRGVFLSLGTSLTPGSPFTENVSNLYTREDLLTPGAGHYRLASACPACTAPLANTQALLDQPAPAAASADFSRVVFESTADLTAESQGLAPNQPKLYESDEGTVTLAGMVPPPGQSECGPSPLPACEPAPNSQAGQGALFNSTTAIAPARYTPNVISQDGSRIYFTVRGVDAGSGPLYLRTDNGTPAATTVRVDAIEPAGTPSPAEDARYWGATPDGSKVLFTTHRNLIASDTSGEATTDLYMYDVNAPAGHHLTRISTPDAGPALSADVRVVIGMSTDGHYVYFVSTQQLVAGMPTTNTSRIFVWHDGVIHDVGAATPDTVDALGGLGSWGLVPLASRVSPDGKRLVFRSTASPPPVGSDALPHSGVGDGCAAVGGCEEVYFYDAEADGGAGRVTCVSCHQPDGASQSDATFVPNIGRGVAGLTSYLNHPLSADGRHVFFDTADRLLPEDTDNATDVYEYDTATEQLHLISSGTDPGGSYFMDASADGSNVFFVTHQRLLGWDTDNAIDLYDARVDGGFPEPAAEVAECAGAGCRPAPPTPPGAAGAGTATFNGGANAKPKCKKGHVKKHGKCVKQKAKKHHKKHSGKKHHGKKAAHKQGGGK